MRGREAIAAVLAAQGIDTMFGLLGDGNLFIVEAMMKNHGLRFTAATHEANAVCMAEGWARVSGRLGVATVTHGPGLTNTTTALIEGVRNRTPLLLIAADTPRGARHHLQNIAQRPLVLATGAAFETVQQIEDIEEVTAHAIRRAHAERRPVVLNIPLDLQWLNDVDIDTVDPAAVPFQALAPDPRALDIAVGMLATASRPLLLAGRGAVDAEAKDALVALGERLGAPLCTTLLASGLFRGHPFDLGLHGTLSHELASEVITSADCVMTFGSSLNVYTTDHGRLMADKTVIQCDLDVERLGSTVPVDAVVVGDARRVAETVLEWLEEADHRPSSFASPELSRRLADFDPTVVSDDRTTDFQLDPRVVTARLDRLIPEERTVVVDAGRFMLDGLRLSVPEPAALVTSHAFGSIGLGMSNAIGAAVGMPGRPTVLAIGDGGFMMGGLGEFHTAVEMNLDLIVLLYNDGSYGAEHIQLVREQLDTKASLHHWPDFSTVLPALGAKHVSLQTTEDFAEVAVAITEREPGRPLVIEICLDPDLVSSIPRGSH